MARIPVQRLYHATVVVQDWQATARNYARLLGITRWSVRHWSPDRLRQAQAFGYASEFGYSSAIGRNPHGVTFRLVQPTHGFSAFTEYLITRGEGVHSLCLSVQSDPHPPADGVRVAQSVTLPNGATSVLLDTRAFLGGYCLEVASEAESSLPPDEEWDFSADVEPLPADVEWLARIPKIGHFGIAVSVLLDRLPNYAALLGLERWNGVHFHPAPGSLQSSTYYGQPVENAWIIAITDVADFGLELLQGTREPTDYGQTISRTGEGIHHVLVRRDITCSESVALQRWMESMRIGVVMRGVVRFGAAEFFYYDTRAALGFLLEVIVAHDVAPPPTTSPGLPRSFTLDFSRPA